MNEILKKLLPYSGISEKEIYITIELYSICKKREIEIYLEQTLKRCGRPDAILIINDKPIIIECKIKEKGNHINIYDSQFIKYSRSGLPIVVLSDKDLIEEMLNFLFKKEKLKGIYLYNFHKKMFINHRLKEITEENEKNYKKYMKLNRLFPEDEWSECYER